VGGLIGARLLSFNRNKIILSGVLTGIASGYFFTQAFLSTRLAEAKVILSRGNSTDDGFRPAEGNDGSSRI